MFKYDNYEKMTDIIYDLDFATSLNFTTILYVKDKDDVNRSIHQEFRYSKSGFSHPVNMIKRKLEYYLSIDRAKIKDDPKMQIRIYPSDMLVFQTMINKALEWFKSSRYNGLYTSDNNGVLKISMNVQTIQIKLKYGNYLAMEPSVINMTIPAVRLYLNKDIYINISASVLSGLVYTINNFNMSMYSATMLNYLQRPQLGYNMTSFDYNNDNNDVQIQEKPVSNGNKNHIQTKSFMDKMNDLSK